jgi:hypothetical protein
MLLFIAPLGTMSASSGADRLDDLPVSISRRLYNKQPICYVALSSQKNYCSLYLMGALMTKAGQAQKAKQGAPSASKVAAKRVDTKRLR